MDLNMLVTTGGRERTEAEFRAPFEQASLRMLGAPIQLPDSRNTLFQFIAADAGEAESALLFEAMKRRVDAADVRDESPRLAPV